MRNERDSWGGAENCRVDAFFPRHLQEILAGIAFAVAGIAHSSGRAEEVRESTIAYVASSCKDHNFDKKVWERYLPNDKPSNKFREITRIPPELMASLGKKGKFFIIMGSHDCAACAIAKEWWEKVDLGGFSPIYLTTRGGEIGLDDYDKNYADIESLFGKGLLTGNHLPYGFLVQDGKLLKFSNDGLCNVTNDDNGIAVFLNKLEGKVK